MSFDNDCNFSNWLQGGYFSPIIHDESKCYFKNKYRAPTYIV